MSKVGVKKIRYAKSGKLPDSFFDWRDNGTSMLMMKSFSEFDFVQDEAFLSENSVDDENGLSYDIKLDFTTRKDLLKNQKLLKSLIGLPLIFAVDAVDGKTYIIGTNESPAYMQGNNLYNKLTTREMTFSVDYKNLDGLLDKKFVSYNNSSIIVTPSVIETSWLGGLYNINVFSPQEWQISNNRNMIFTTANKTSSTNVAGQTSIHTGRTSRTDTVRLTTDNDVSKDVVVTQSGKPEFVQITDTSPKNIAVNATSFQVRAKSNSSKITASFGNNEIGAKLGTITVNGTAITNGTAIAGDPGAAAEYDLIVNCTCGANSLARVLSSVLILTDNAGHTAQITINQAAAESTISVNPDTITAPATGGSFTITVTSNDDWDVEVID